MSLTGGAGVEGESVDLSGREIGGRDAFTRVGAVDPESRALRVCELAPLLPPLPWTWAF